MAAQRGSSSSGGGGGGSSSSVDTTFTKIFVGGLAWETQCETMRRYFEQFGEIVEAVVITDKTTGRSKGYGFVTFRDPEAARRACMDPAPIIDGRRTNCNLAALGAHRSRPTSPLFQGARFIPYMGDFGGQMFHGGGGAPHFGQPLHFPYPQGFPFPPPFGYPPYGPEFYGAQGMYPFMGPQFPSVYTPQSPFHQLHDSQGAGTIAPPQAQAMTPLSPPHPPLIGSPYIPSHMQPHLVPIPFHSPTGVVTAPPGPSSQRFGLPSPSAQPFTPGGSSEQSSS